VATFTSDPTRLPPDDLEMRIASTRGLLAPCPFCGRDVLLSTSQNEITKLYVAKIFCADCFVGMTSCMPERADAQQTVADRWAVRRG